MKRVIIVLFIALLSITGCSNEVKKSNNSKVADSNPKTQNQETSKEITTPLSKNELIYMKTIDKFVTTFVDKVNDMHQYLSQPSTNPSIVNNEDWRNGLRGDFTAIKVMSSVMDSMSSNNAVPLRFLTLHDNARECFRLMGSAGDKLFYATEHNLDPAAFNESMQLIAQSNAKLELVNKQLDEVQKESNNK